MTFSRPRFDWSFNFGHVAIVIGGMMTAIFMYGGQVRTEERFGAALEAVNLRVERAERVTAENASRYRPQLDSLLQTQIVQDERINNLAQGAIESRRAYSEITAKLNSISEDMAAIKSRLGVQKP